MADFVSISDCAADVGVPPKAISEGFFAGWLDRTRCPMVGNRRIIPKSYLPELNRIFAERRGRKRLAAASS